MSITIGGGTTLGGQGAQGPQGSVGPQGSAGTAGVAGPQGSVGPQGSAGIAGPQGAAGPAGSGDVSGTVDGHLIPDSNEAYDLGSAEYKFRHLYLSDNSVHTDGGDLSFVGGILSYGNDPVLMLSDVKRIASESETFAEFKTSLENL